MQFLVDKSDIGNSIYSFKDKLKEYDFIQIDNDELKNIYREKNKDIILNMLSINKPTIYFGSIQFNNILEKMMLPFSPGHYWYLDKMKFSYFSTYYENNLLLNNEYQISTFKEFINNTKEVCFFRPDVSTKTISGNIYNPNNNTDYNFYKDKIPLHDIVVKAPLKNILEEYRLFIINKKLVTGSRYIKKNKIESKNISILDNYNEIYDFSLKAIECWEPDICYTLDVCLLEDMSYKIVEVNSINSSGLYESDIETLIKHISECAYNDFIY